LFVPPLVAYLAFHELRHTRRAPEASPWGFALLVPALLLHAVDAGMHTQLLSALALIVAIPGLCLLLIGAPRTRLIAFPLAFLLFALPIPLAFTEQIHLALRHLTAGAVAFLVPFAGIPVYLEATTLHMAGSVLEVADACSGFSTLYAALATAALTAYTASGMTRRCIVIAAAAPIAMACNVARVSALVMLTVWYGEAVLDTIVHPLSGILTFVLALPVIFWLGGRPSAPERA
jgi:exosortase